MSDLSARHGRNTQVSARNLRSRTTGLNSTLTTMLPSHGGRINLTMSNIPLGVLVGQGL